MLSARKIIIAPCSRKAVAQAGVFEQGDCPTNGAPDDVSLPPLQRVQRFARSGNIFDRQMVARVVQELFRTVPPETLAVDLPDIMKILTKIAEESMLKADLLEQIPHIAAQAIECSTRVSALKNIVSDHLIPLVVNNLGCTDTAVDKAAHSTLIQLIEQGFITRQQAEIQVCPSILALSKVECVADINTGAITLMSKMAPLLGRDVTERVFLKRFTELCGSHMFYLRKVCASHFGDFCAVVGKDSFEKILLPTYITLCQDDVWGVRKSCAEVIMLVSCVCPPTIRRSTLSPVFIRLLQDDCKWVRMSAFQTLGPFIATFADPTITNLAYNNVGEIVLVNGEGNEFLMNTPSVMMQKLLLPLCTDRDDDVVMNPLSETLVYEDGSSADLPQEEPPPLEETEDLEEEEVGNKGEIQFYSRTKKSSGMKFLLSEDKSENVMNSPPEEPPPLNETLENEEATKMAETITNLANLGFEIDNAAKEGELLTVEKTNISNANVINDKVDSELKELIDDITKLFINEPIVNCVGQTDCNLNIANSSLSNDSNCNNEQEIKNTSDNTPTTESNEDNKQSHLEDLYSTINLNDSVGDTTVNTSNAEDTNSKNGPDAKEKMEEKKPAQDVVPQLLIDHFISMTDSSAVNIDNEMTYHCAYSLPAVALTLGSKNWHLLKNTVESLAGDMQYKVRRTVASGLHELALILGPEIATSNLTPLFNGFIKDLDEVRIGVLKNLAHFLRLINPVKRNTYLPRFQEFLQTDNEGNWRFRQELAKQLLLAVTLFRPTDAAKYIGIIAQDLLCDKVSAVRQVALLLITEIVKYISTEQGLTPNLLVKLAERFAHSKKWKRRQTFALLCSELLVNEALPPEQFESEVMPHLLDLSWDPVANVRLVVARTLAKHIITNEYFADPSNPHYDGLETILRRLQADKDRDVRQSAEIEEPIPTY